VWETKTSQPPYAILKIFPRQQSTRWRVLFNGKIQQNQRGVGVGNSEYYQKGKWKIRSPLVPQIMALGDGWLLGMVIRSPFYFHRPPLILSPEDVSNLFHLFDE
jgi:hypothetical protein